eukprot:CAMPEP_0194162152 /NCGR_PEP_ID=MMETSP0152-20130528/79333_1 /TAXON_ID=1049557 /ORGANISM="Thalassiothrix antarctica, Strain L6-D1" /LENGTH=841 /DNA_ID=CAMNT_0038872029 /DNA_START=205 /DNA_END=2729 /DNA_ORIENTATION=+
MLDKFQRFENWLRENGAFFDLLELREYDTPTTDKDESVEVVHEEKKESPMEVTESEMRGVHSRADVPPDTICMMIPRKCLITVEMGQATPLGKTVLESDLDLDAPKHIYLMIYILWDRKVNGPNSFFHPYYEILPSTLKNMPIFWSSDELAGLDGSYLLKQIADRNKAITNDYHAICNFAPDLGDLCTLEEFKWARMCVCSRNFGLQIDGHRTSAMVPHADMLNHYRPRETKWTFEEDRQAFTITTLQGIPSGAQVYDSYGQKCNHRFLLNYGFAVEDNREIDGFCPNEVPIDLTVDPNDPLYGKKVEFWTRSENDTYNNILTAALVAYNATTADIFATPIVKRVRVCVSNNENSRLLFSMLRALACNDEELDAVTSGPSSATDHHHGRIGGGILPAFYRSCRDIHHPIGLRNERVAMMLLLEIITRSLAAYPTTLQEDVKDLSDKAAFPRFSNKRHAKIQVRGEKKVLQTKMQSSFLLNYGFAVEDNCEIDGFCPNEVSIDLSVDPNDLLYGKRVEFWTCATTAGIFASKAATAAIVKRVRVCVSNNENSRLLFSLLRVLAYNEEEIDFVTSVGGFIDHPIGLRNERVAMMLLLKIITRSLAAYPTTLREDVKDLSDEAAFPRFSNKRHAKIQVRGEKEVLHHFAQWARAAMDVMDVIERELNGDSIPSFDATIASFLTSSMHDIILLYCEDVLGSLRREEWINSRRSNSRMTTTTGGKNTIIIPIRHQEAAAATTIITKFGVSNVKDVIERELNGDSIPSFEATIASFLTLSHDNDNVMNDIILLYCEEVLGSLRREEWKKSRRSNNRTTTTTGGKNTNNNTNSSSSGSSNNHHHPQIW